MSCSTERSHRTRELLKQDPTSYMSPGQPSRRAHPIIHPHLPVGHAGDTTTHSAAVLNHSTALPEVSRRWVCTPVVRLPTDDAGVLVGGDVVAFGGLGDTLDICAPFQSRLGQSSHVPSEDLGRVPGPRAASEVDRNVWVMNPALERLGLRRATTSPGSDGVVVVGCW